MTYLGANNHNLFSTKTFVDEWGLLDKLSGADGGDSGQREGMYWALLAMIKETTEQAAFRRNKESYLKQYHKVMDKIHPTPGLILRHSNPDYDASDWDRMSRDQLQPNIIAAGYWDKEELQDLNKGCRRRGYLFASNTRRNGATKYNHGEDVAGEVRDFSWKLPDLTGPEIMGNLIRAYKAWYLYPILILCDFELLGGAIKWRYFAKHNITMNQTLSQMQAADRMGTPLSWLANKVMPIPKLITLLEDHFTDFSKDMRFFGPMFRKALESIKRR